MHPSVGDMFRAVRNATARTIENSRNRRDMRALSSLPDYLLRDIGMTRGPRGEVWPL